MLANGTDRLRMLGMGLAALLMAALLPACGELGELPSGTYEIAVENKEGEDGKVVVSESVDGLGTSTETVLSGASTSTTIVKDAPVMSDTMTTKSEESTAAKTRPDYFATGPNEQGAKQAIASLVAGFDVTPDLEDAKPHHEKGVRAIEAGRYADAIEHLDKAVDLVSTFALAYSDRGRAHSAQGDHVQAMADHEKAMELDPGNHALYVNRGVSHADADSHKLAIKDYDFAISLKPDYVLAYLSRASSYVSLGERDKALDDYAKAADLDVDENYEWRISTETGFLHREMGNLDLALDSFDMAVATQNNARSHVNRGHLYMQMGEYDLARKDFSFALRYVKDSPSLVLSMATARAHLGDHTRALWSYNNVIEMAPDNADAYIGRAMSLVELDRTDEALADLATALSLGGDRELVERIQERISWEGK